MADHKILDHPDAHKISFRWTFERLPEQVELIHENFGHRGDRLYWFGILAVGFESWTLDWRHDAAD